MKMVEAYRIKPDDLERWRRDSIETARKKKLLDDPVLDYLNKVDLELLQGEIPDVWYGCASYEKVSELISFQEKEPKYVISRKPNEPKVRVYEENHARFLPRYLREIYDQSGMDHELIGHIGNYLSKKPHGETPACVTQKRMAEERANNSLGWKSASVIIPLIQKLHKDVKISNYYQ